MNNETEIKAALQASYNDVMTTSEMMEKYSVVGFCAPYVTVNRKSDGVLGTLEFTHMPRFYYGFMESN